MPTEQKFVSARIPLIDGVQIFTNRSEVEQVAVRRNIRKYNKCLKMGDGLLRDIKVLLPIYWHIPGLLFFEPLSNRFSSNIAMMVVCYLQIFRAQ